MVEWISHRGESYDAPENTLAAFQLAWQRQTDGAECDVHLTADEQIVVMHDANTHRTAGRDRLIREQTLADLQQLDAGVWKNPAFAGQKIPTLPQLLEIVPPGKRLWVEIKAGLESVAVLKKLVARCSLSPEQIAFICFNYDVCRSVKQALARHQVYLLGVIERPGEHTGPEVKSVAEFIAMARQAKLEGLDLNAEWNREEVAAAKAAGLFCAAWTVDELPHARRMIDCGIESITSNRAAYLRDALNSTR